MQNGIEWDKVTQEYLRLSKLDGVPCKSTLPNRYQRIKNNFAVVRQEDELLIIEAKKELEKTFEDELWGKVVVLVKRNGGASYNVSIAAASRISY